MDGTVAFNDPIPGTQGYTLTTEEAGDRGAFPPPYYAKHGAIGRGLFATRDIREGELVHDGGLSDVSFPSGMAWREYVFALPRNKACDMIDWTWTQKTSEGGKYRIFSAMNISVLCNGAMEDGEVNMTPRESTSSKMYATRDIQKGEEILTDYEMYDTVWGKVGLGSLPNGEDDDGYDDDRQNGGGGR